MTVTEWSRFTDKLGSYIARRVPEAYVDDLVGDVLLRLVDNQTAFNNANNPVAWMYRVAANVIADHYRQHSTEQQGVDIDDQLTDNMVVSTDISPQQELALCLVPLIRKLPDRYRQALELVEIAGLKQADAALELNLSLSGTKSRVQRGRLLLKQLLLDCCAIEINRNGGVVDYFSKSRCC
jgi:RNA polymerase sigma-70 factor (ECF subfamily)